MTKDEQKNDRSAPLPEGDALLLAAYLDGRLGEAEAARLEARLAGEANLLDELPALRRSLAAAPEAVPAQVLDRIVARAQALQPPAQSLLAVSPLAKAAVRNQPSWIGGLLALWLRPAVPAFAALTLLLAGVSAFELGRLQASEQEAPAGAETGGDLPADLLWGGLL